MNKGITKAVDKCLCDYNGSFWVCKSDKIEDQKDCPKFEKSAHRNCCMYYCNQGRCDNINACK